MHPVLPRTMVRGPAALTIIFITSADSQPWQVRCPEVKNSSKGSFFTPLKASSRCVGCSLNNSASSLSFATVAIAILLLAQPDPLRSGLGLSFRSQVNFLGHLFYIRHGH